MLALLATHAYLCCAGWAAVNVLGPLVGEFSLLHRLQCQHAIDKGRQGMSECPLTPSPVYVAAAATAVLASGLQADNIMPARCACLVPCTRAVVVAHLLLLLLLTQRLLCTCRGQLAVAAASSL